MVGEFLVGFGEALAKIVPDHDITTLLVVPHFWRAVLEDGLFVDLDPIGLDLGDNIFTPTIPERMALVVVLDFLLNRFGKLLGGVSEFPLVS
jgi:hypothetical protein